MSEPSTSSEPGVEELLGLLSEHNRLARLFLVKLHARPDRVDREGNCGADACVVCGEVEE